MAANFCPSAAWITIGIFKLYWPFAFAYYPVDVDLLIIDLVVHLLMLRCLHYMATKSAAFIIHHLFSYAFELILYYKICHLDLNIHG